MAVVHLDPSDSGLVLQKGGRARPVDGAEGVRAEPQQRNSISVSLFHSGKRSGAAGGRGEYM